jgi:hypothetical protein
MKAYGGVYPRFLDLGTSWTLSGQLHALAVLFLEGQTSTHWTGGWVGARTCLDDVVRKKFLTLPELELRLPCLPARSQSLYLLCYPRFNIVLVQCQFYAMSAC